MKIAFAHNVYNRYVTLRDTLMVENTLFPDSKISVAHNGDVFLNIFQSIKNVEFVNFIQKPHKIGCVNGCIISIQQLLKEYFDVLIFSHDDVSINVEYFETIQQHLEDIDNKSYDIICRKPNIEYGSNYYMMEVFYISRTAAIEVFENMTIFENEENIVKDIRNSISPEVWLYAAFNNKNLKIKEIQFESNLISYNKQLGLQMGFTHKNAGQRGWKD